MLFTAIFPHFIATLSPEPLLHGMLGNMKSFFRLFSGITWRRLATTILLTTIGSIIVMPYFGHEIEFYFLWLRIAVVAVIMLMAFTVTGNLQLTRFKREHVQLGALVLAAFLGTIISGLLIGRSLVQMFTVDAMFWGIVIFTAVGIAIGIVAATLLVYRERQSRAYAELVASESRRHELEKSMLAAHLKLLKAQIEPHFLFNTLANVQHLVDSNPASASRMLASLIRYLRAALPEMRAEMTTLGKEVDMAKAFLEIQQVRMGARLAYTIDLPHDLENFPFPPMILITLVENAVKHGIDPGCEQGHIAIQAICKSNYIAITVTDTGPGLSDQHGTGVGLKNVRERLRTLYDGQARLELAEHEGGGFMATINIPIAA